MKKVIVMLTLGVLVAGSSFAQDAPQKENKSRTEQRKSRDFGRDKKSPEERAQLRTERLSQKLDLNSAQTRKLQALNLKQVNEMQAMRAKYKDADRRNPKQREEMKALHTKWEAELKDILTKKQYAQYEADRKEMRAHLEKRGEQHKGKEFRGREGRQSEKS